MDVGLLALMVLTILFAFTVGSQLSEGFALRRIERYEQDDLKAKQAKRRNEL